MLSKACPVQLKSSLVPAHHHFWQDNYERSYPVRSKLPSCNPKQFVAQTEAWFRMSAFVHGELVPEYQVFQNKIPPTRKNPDECSEPHVDEIYSKVSFNEQRRLPY